MFVTALAVTLLTAQVTPERIRVGGNIQAANLIKKVTPVYPPMAKQARIQGTVRFTVIIAKDGTIANLQLVSGHPLLVPSATEAVQQWVYKPTLLNGQPVEVITQIDVNFTLSDDARWAVNWTFASKFKVEGDGNPDVTAGVPVLRSDGSFKSADPALSAWRFRPLTLDGGEPFEPSVYFVERQPGMPDVIGSWKVMAPRVLSRREPVNPDPELHGNVTVDCIVNRDGAVERILAVRGNTKIETAVRDAVQDWKFRPVSINGETYAVRAYLQLEF